MISQLVKKKKETNRADLSWSVISYVIEVSALVGTIKYDSCSPYFENSLQLKIFPFYIIFSPLRPCSIDFRIPEIMVDYIIFQCSLDPLL